MKKVLFFLSSITLLFLLLAGCTVNSTTGKIMISNRTNTALTNIRIGNTLISSYVAPGATYDYWYYSDITGKLALSGVDHLDYYGEDPDKDTTYTGYDDLDLTFKVNHWVYITASIINTDNAANVDGDSLDRGDTYVAISVVKQGSDDDFDAKDWCDE